jgi:hypothetical protein
MVPIAEVPNQDIRPWCGALERLLSDRMHYDDLARASRAAAIDYAVSLSVEPLERLLEDTPRHVRASRTSLAQPHLPGMGGLSGEKRRFLGMRLRNRAPSSAWFPV